MSEGLSAEDNQHAIDLYAEHKDEADLLRNALESKSKVEADPDSSQKDKEYLGDKLVAEARMYYESNIDRAREHVKENLPEYTAQAHEEETSSRLNELKGSDSGSDGDV